MLLERTELDQNAIKVNEDKVVEHVSKHAIHKVLENSRAWQDIWNDHGEYWKQFSIHRLSWCSHEAMKISAQTKGGISHINSSQWPQYCLSWYHIRTFLCIKCLTYLLKHYLVLFIWLEPKRSHKTHLLTTMLILSPFPDILFRFTILITWPN